jgi:catechol 2,3-dioxygenase
VNASNTQANAGLFSPRRIGHVNFWTHDYQAVADFYRSIVGVEEVYRRPTVQAIFMSNGNTYHDLAFMDLAGPRGVGRSPGLHHFSFELENERELVEGYYRALEAGFEFDVTLSADVARSAYGSDPDGNRFEVYADVKSNWRTERQGSVPGANVKWVPGESEPLQESFYPVDPEITVLPDAVFHPRRVSHAVLVTKDYAAMFGHYTKIVGLHPLVGSLDDSYVVLGGRLGEETLTLFRSEGRRAPGLHHFGMELADEAELTAAKARLAARGLKPEFEVDHGTRRSLYLRDPNNQLIQFFVNRRSDYASWAQLPPDIALFVA